MPKRIMHSFKIDEISAVTRPAQKHALATIMKGDNMATKTEDGKQFPASDYAHVPDNNDPSTWKLRLTKEPGGPPDAGIVGAAAAALGAGFRGNKVDIPTTDRASVVARVRSAWAKANPTKKPEEAPEELKKGVFEDTVELLTKAIAADPSTCTDLGIDMDADDAPADVAKAYVTKLRDSVSLDFVESFGKMLAKASDQTKPDDKETQMSDTDAQKIAGLEKQVADLTKANTDLTTKVTDLTKANTDLTTANTSLTKAAEIAKTDEVFESEGQTIRKSEVGAPVFTVMKAQFDRIELNDFEKSAAREVPNLPGEMTLKAKIMRTVAKISDKDIREGLHAMLKAGSVAMKAQLTPVGFVKTESFSKASDELDSLVAAHAEKNSVSKADAYTAVLKTERGKQLYADMDKERAPVANNG